MGALLWLASYPKSGNTWVRAFLHNLLMNPDKPVSTNELTKFTTSDIAHAWYAPYTSKGPGELSDDEVAELRPKVHRDLTKVHPDTVFVKTHGVLGELNGKPLFNMDVTAGAVYIVRNPLDVSLSLASHLGVSVDEAIEVMASAGAKSYPTSHQVTEFWGSWSHNVRSWTSNPHSQLKIIRYEDLYNRPSKSFRSIVRFLGLQPPKPRLQKAIRFSSFDTLKKLEDTEGFNERSGKAERFFRKGVPAQWKDELTEKQVARIVETQAAEMRRFAYMTRHLEEVATAG